MCRAALQTGLTPQQARARKVQSRRLAHPRDKAAHHRPTMQVAPSSAPSAGSEVLVGTLWTVGTLPFTGALVARSRTARAAVLQSLMQRERQSRAAAMVPLQAAVS